LYLKLADIQNFLVRNH